ncbi:MAG TPA: hypothetical protein VFT50_13020 [Baekduia sp.]|nr:hypothetical protein [Baekduia sp.]
MPPTVQEHTLGLTWVMDDPMRRACHALIDDDERLWLVDPVDDGHAVEHAVALGRPAAVLQLLDRHNRDCAAVAARLGVPHLKVPDAVPGSPFVLQRLIRNRLWNEVALLWPERRALVVAEALGTAPGFAVGDGPVGMHPMLRLLPPRGLRGDNLRHLLVGHGRPLHGREVPGAIDGAVANARRDLPRLLRQLPAMVRAVR